MGQTIIASQNQETSMRKAALIAGLGVLIMALTVPVVEFYIFPKLIDYKNATQTTNNIANNRTLFSTAIFVHFITIICDVTVAWALYIFLKPVNKNLALLTAWFRLVYTAFNIVALLNLIQILSLLKISEHFNKVDQGKVSDYVLFYMKSFDLEWRFGLVFFGIYLCLLGYLVFRSEYIPKIIGVFLVVAGLGYLIDALNIFSTQTLTRDFFGLHFLGS